MQTEMWDNVETVLYPNSAQVVHLQIIRSPDEHPGLTELYELGQTVASDTNSLEFTQESFGMESSHQEECSIGITEDDDEDEELVGLGFLECGEIPSLELPSLMQFDLDFLNVEPPKAPAGSRRNGS